MAGKGIEIGIASETRAFKQGVEAGIIKPLDDAVEALEYLGESKGPEQLERGLKDAQDASKRLERETKETADTIEREFRDSYRKVGRSADQGMRTAGDATRAFKDEAKQNFVEVGSSFDGSIQGVADGIQGTLAGASIAVGGAAGVALGAMAVVGGAVGSAMATAIEEDAAASEERIKSMYDNFIESGLTYLTEKQKLEEASNILSDETKRAEATKIANALGMSTVDVILAQVSAGQERNAVQAALTAEIEATRDGTIRQSEADRLREALLTQYLDKFKTLNSEQQESTLAAEQYRAIAEKVTGQEQLTNEEIQIRNRRLAETPLQTTTTLVVDSTALDRELTRRRTVRLDAEVYTRQGTRVF